jgi:ATP-binding cassette subfamily C protein CydCD
VVARAGALGGTVAALVADLTALAAVGLAVPLLATGDLPGERLAGVVLLALGVFEAVAPLPAAFAAQGEARAAASRLAEITDAAPAVAEPACPATPGPGLRLEARGLSFAYPGAARPALLDVSFVLEPGRLVAVVGPSGAGKSTLGRLAARFYDVPPASLFLDGRDVRDLASDAVRARLAVCAQPFHVFGTSLRENLLLARPQAKPLDLEAAIEWAGLGPLVARLPRGVAAPVGEQAARLSGGERQRVALARAHLSEARLLVLDEPTTHLDAASEAEVLLKVSELARERGVLLVTHRFGGLAAADEILVLEGGLLRERGRFEALARAGGLFERGLRAEEDASLDERFGHPGQKGN